MFYALQGRHCQCHKYQSTTKLSLFWNNINFFCHLFPIFAHCSWCCRFSLVWTDINKSTKIYVTVWDLDLSNLNLRWIMNSGLFSRAESCNNMEQCTFVIRAKSWMSKRIGCVTRQLCKYNSPSFYSLWNKHCSFTKVSQSIAYPAIILLTNILCLGYPERLHSVSLKVSSKPQGKGAINSSLFL